MSGVGITYLWISKEFPPFVRLEGKRGDYEVYTPERTCCIVKTPSDSDFSDDWRYRCSECGCNIPVNERDPKTGDVINAANFCPNCGAKVVGE